MNTTIKRTVKNDVADRIELEIGDAKQEQAFPQSKVMRWDNEVNLSVRRDNGSRTFRQEEDKIRFESSKEDVVIYELEEGLEIELHLKEKPESNVFDFSIETKGLNFYYQPDLTAAEIEQGANRPDNVVGSYAVYHATKRNNLVNGKHYKAGKFCHIYRPHVVDSKGVETWAELFVDVDTKILRVTVPQEYLDKASYPIIVDPTFGYTTAGASTQTTYQDYSSVYNTYGTYFAGTYSADISSISIYLTNTDWSGAKQWSAAIYDSVDISGADKEPDVLLASTPYNDASISSDGWDTRAVSASISGVSNPFIFVMGDDVYYQGNTMYISYDTAASNITTVFFDSEVTNDGRLFLPLDTPPWRDNVQTWKDTTTDENIDYYPREISVYATYEEITPEPVKLYYKESGTFRLISG